MQREWTNTKGRLARWLLPVVLTWLALSPSGQMQTISDTTRQSISSDKVSSDARLKLFVMEKTLKLIIPKSETTIGALVDITELDKNAENEELFKLIKNKLNKFIDNKIVKAITSDTIKTCIDKGETVKRLVSDTTKGWNAIKRYIDSTSDISEQSVNVTITMRGLKKQLEEILIPLEEEQSKLEAAAKAYDDINTGTGRKTTLPRLENTLSNLYCKVTKETRQAAKEARAIVRHYSNILNMLANNRNRQEPFSSKRSKSSLSDR